MPSGREMLESIDEALKRMRREADALDAGFQRAGGQLAEARQTQLSILNRIASVRIAELERGELQHALDDTDRRVTEVIAARRAAQEALAAELAAAEEKLAALERDRAAQQSAVDAAAEAVDAAEAEAQRALEADETYQAKLAAARRSDAVADQAEEKAQGAQADRVEKGRPYEADPVFVYLWQRGYGTAEYRASPPARLLDRWAARAAGYETLRRNYALLIEIPRRLAEHAARMRELANRDFDTARVIEDAAAEAAGVPERSQALEGEEQRLAELDAAIEEQEGLVATLIDKRGRFANGEDEFSVRCTTLLTDAFGREDIDALRKRAARTRSPEDDALIDELEALDDELDRLEQERIEYRRLHQAQRERMLGLEEIRRRFKQNRYDDVHSEFVNGELIASLLERFVGGAADTDELWNTIRRQQRFRRIDADPRYGTGGLRGAPFPGPWRTPGGGSWNFPKGGGFGGGGFGSGGGFGGGGFRTGGGF